MICLPLTVEADTTYIGGKEANKHRNKRDSKKIGGMGKQIVHSLVGRGGRSPPHHIANISGKTLRPRVSDGERAAKALLGIEGKRLTYRIPNKTTDA